MCDEFEQRYFSFWLVSKEKSIIYLLLYEANYIDGLSCTDSFIIVKLRSLSFTLP